MVNDMETFSQIIPNVVNDMGTFSQIIPKVVNNKGTFSQVKVLNEMGTLPSYSQGCE